MRVITGTARGRRLKELQGMETRPTTDRVKEAIFSIIQFELEGRRVLDLFAGTGQLGIEALSRGAAKADFVDQRRDAAALIRENLQLCQLADRGTVHCAEAFAFLASCRETYDIILLDPPYGTGLLQKALEQIQKFDILRDHGIIICESPLEEKPAELALPYGLHRTYRYGKIQVATYRKEGGDRL